MSENEPTKDAWAEAAAILDLRAQLTTAVTGAVNHGLNRDWANAELAKLGAKPITGRTEYRMNTPITGFYGWRCTATSRAEAADRFREQIQRVAQAGKITADGSYDNVYGVHFVNNEVTFYSGPEDVEPSDEAQAMSLEELGAAIRSMVKRGVSEHGWNLGWAQQALRKMGLPELPNASHRTVAVPVSGTVEMVILAFEGDSDDAVQAAARGAVARSGRVYVQPDEVGTAVVSAPTAEATDDETPY
jgi:hypothetical protein